MNISNNGSWVEINNLIPFRTLYLYWDKKPFLGDCEFKRRGLKVGRIKWLFTHPDYPYIGVIISCWTKDKTKVEEAMNSLDDRLRRLDGRYTEFLKLWQQNVLDFLKEKERG